jgi:2,4-dienoyl-CoA reductase-like NADH-dependent reductase (Old Yellow Enzyme family)
MFYQGKSKVLPHLFQPFHLGKLELRNRLVMPPMVTFLVNESGGVTQRMIDYYAERARGGVGLITIESAYVLEKDRDMGRLGIENPQLLVGLNELAEAIQEEGPELFSSSTTGGASSVSIRGKGRTSLTRRRSKKSSSFLPRRPGRRRRSGSTGWRSTGPTSTGSLNSCLP